jgi:hypothetical protein
MNCQIDAGKKENVFKIQVSRLGKCKYFFISLTPSKILNAASSLVSKKRHVKIIFVSKRCFNKSGMN